MEHSDLRFSRFKDSLERGAAVVEVVGKGEGVCK